MFDRVFAGRALVVAPHPDDEVIGCGGTLLRFRDQITHLAVAHLTASPSRIGEFHRVRDAIGIDAHYNVGHEDGFCTAAGKRIRLELIRVIQAERPDVVLTPHRHDSHADHQAASRYTRDAIDKARYWPPSQGDATHRVPTVLEYEVWTPILRPAVIYDITCSFERKLNLMAEYQSQTSTFPYIDYVRSINSWRGLTHYCGGYAEAFGCYAI